jgi:protein SMG6
MTTLHPFMTSRESILPLWSASVQARRSHPDTRAPELFILLHGMLFTNIQLDDFQPTLARFVERLQIEGAEEREWAMMAEINICAVLEYGKPGAVLKKNGAVGGKCDGSTGSTGMRVMTKRAVEEERMDVDSDLVNNAIQTSPAISLPDAADNSELPTSFRLALHVTFAMLTHVLQRPTRKASPFARSTLNPYLTIMLTFLTTMLKHPATLETLQRSVPWAALAQFLATIPSNVISSQMQGYMPGERWTMLTSGCAPPLPEDWCLRGMEWVVRRVYERGYWKSGEDRRPEMEMLDKSEAWEMTDGIIEDGEGDDDDGDRQSQQASKKTDNERRWIRVFRCGVGIADLVDGFTWVEGKREWKVEGSLKSKVELWKEEDRVEREEEEKRRMGRRWTDDSMEIDEYDAESVTSEESEDDESDSDEIRALKASSFKKNPLIFFTLMINMVYRRGDGTYGVCCKPLNAVLQHPPPLVHRQFVDHSRECPTNLLRVPPFQSSRDTLSLLSTPTSFSPPYQCLPRSSRASAGRSSFRFRLLWSSTDSHPMHRSLVRLLGRPRHMSLHIYAHIRPR